MTVRTDEIDGVPVLWAGSATDVVEAQLLFRVGVRDERFLTCGITHLVEHLAMGALGRRPHGHNAGVDLSHTEFTARGRPASVTRHLADLCAALAHLPTERLATELKVLRAEGGLSAHPDVAEQLFRRYGYRGLGLAFVAPVALDRIEPDEIREFAATHFTRGNAVLVLNGPPAAGLRLPLPDGPRRSTAPSPGLDQPLPLWFERPEPGVSLSFRILGTGTAAREAALAVLRIALDRATDRLRHDHGWVYHLDFEGIRDDDGVTVCFYADPLPEHAGDVLNALLRILRDLRDQGPTPAEREHDADALAEGLSTPDPMDEAVPAAIDLLRGDPWAEAVERLRLHAELRTEDLRRPLAHLDQTLIVGVPPGLTPSDPTLRAAPRASTRAVTGEEFRRSPITGRLARLPRAARLVVGDEGVSLVEPDGPVTVTWDDLVGAATDEHDTVVELVGVDGFSLPILTDCFRDGNRAQRLIEDRVPRHLRFRSPPDA